MVSTLMYTSSSLTLGRVHEMLADIPLQLLLAGSLTNLLIAVHILKGLVVLAEDTLGVSWPPLSHAQCTAYAMLQVPTT